MIANDHTRKVNSSLFFLAFLGSTDLFTFHGLICRLNRGHDTLILNLLKKREDLELPVLILTPKSIFDIDLPLSEQG